MPPVLVFDLDDTLFLERDYVRSGFKSVEVWLRDHLGCGGFFNQAWQLFEAGRRGNIFDLSLPQLGLAPEPALIREMIKIYRQHRPEIDLMPDARKVLHAFCRQCQLAVLTDGPHEAQRQKAAVLGVEAWCAPIVYTDLWGRADWKPSPRGYLVLQEHFALPGKVFVYIADNPRKDFIAPRMLGWRTVRIRRPLGEHARVSVPPDQEAEHVITDLAALDCVLNQHAD